MFARKLCDRKEECDSCRNRSVPSDAQMVLPVGPEVKARQNCTIITAVYQAVFAAKAGFNSSKHVALIVNRAKLARMLRDDHFFRYVNL